jgi:hypothetical protein
MVFIAALKRCATLEEIDFVAAYIIPLDLWYIIPAGVVAMRKGSIWLAPWNRQGKYERYLEAWHLLRRWRRGPYAAKGDGTLTGSGGTRGVRRDKDRAPEGLLQASSSSPRKLRVTASGLQSASDLAARRLDPA